MTLDLDALREAMLSAPESSATRIVALLLSLTLVAAVLWLVRRRSLREEYTPIWIAVAFGIAVVSIDYDALAWLTRAIGAWTISSTIFFLGEIFLVAICLNYAVRVSQANVQIKDLAQEIALLRVRLDELEDAPAGGQGRAGVGAGGSAAGSTT